MFVCVFSHGMVHSARSLTPEWCHLAFPQHCRLPLYEPGPSCTYLARAHSTTLSHTSAGPLPPAGQRHHSLLGDAWATLDSRVVCTVTLEQLLAIGVNVDHQDDVAFTPSADINLIRSCWLLSHHGTAPPLHSWAAALSTIGASTWAALRCVAGAHFTIVELWRPRTCTETLFIWILYMPNLSDGIVLGVAYCKCVQFLVFPFFACRACAQLHARVSSITTITRIWWEYSDAWPEWQVLCDVATASPELRSCQPIQDLPSDPVPPTMSKECNPRNAKLQSTTWNQC